MIRHFPDTSTGAITRELVAMRSREGVVSVSRVMTLLVVCGPDDNLDRAVRTANLASNNHPCRVIVIRRCCYAARTRLDAEIRVGADAGAGEVIVLHVHGELVRHLDSLLTPLVLPDAPIVAWWPGAQPAHPAADPVGGLAARRITDAALLGPAMDSIRSLAQGYHRGDTDLAWSRITLWRRVLASALDDVIALTGSAVSVQSVSVTASPASPSGSLLAAWLSSRLGCPLDDLKHCQSGILEASIQLANGSITVTRTSAHSATLSRPGAPPRTIHLPQRSDADCLIEELGRLDHDPVYRETLRAAAR